jgi:transcription-repair coupling factor (superfamily II helicase)
MNPIELLKTSSELARMADFIREGGRAISARGAQGSSAAIVTAALAQILERTCLLVVGHLDDADDTADELASLGVSAARFPALEAASSGSRGGGSELLAERLRLIQRLADDDPPRVIVAPITALMQEIPGGEEVKRIWRVLHVRDSVDPGELATWLVEAGFQRVNAVANPGEFSVRGGIMDIFSSGDQPPIRIDFFGNEIETMWEVDVETLGSDRKIERAEIMAAGSPSLPGIGLKDASHPAVCRPPQPSPSKRGRESESPTLIDLLPSTSFMVIAELLEVNEQGRGYFERVTDARGIIPPTEVFARAKTACAAIIDINQFSEGAAAEARVQLPVSALPSFAEETPAAIAELGEMATSHRVSVVCQNDGEAHRFRELAADHAPNARIDVEVAYLHRGFVWDERFESSAAGSAHSEPSPSGSGQGKREVANDIDSQSPSPPASFPGGEGRRARAWGSHAFIPYHELLHRYHTRRRLRRLPGAGAGVGRMLDSFLDLEPGDLVVHRDHGIARFIEFGRLTVRAASGTIPDEEYLTLEFADGAKLHVPASQIALVQKYVGGFRGRPELSRLGGKRWKKQKEDAEGAVRDLATEMLQVQAAREALPGVRYPADTVWQREFEAEFPYEETEDQLAAIAAVKRDMMSERPMDRLICGDVGFGKTEVAIRAAFKAVEYGKQVAVLVPTTVLAEQHEQTFMERYRDYPFRVESISRFKTKKEQGDVLEEVAKGRVDIIIGTHRLLSEDVKFADLGLVIVDEEQRFGVEHKQRLLSFRMTADVLTLSATPIPRTMHMALLGLRDISSLATAPADRRAIVTEVIPREQERIKQAIERELAREGQIFFVHNRIHDIESVADDVRRLAPDARIVIGHGQMPPRELERVMLAFMRREADILVSTTIIESGIDIPTANTMFIDGADMFGLSDLHQLRGRVGRYKHRAYCYLLLPDDRTMTEAAIRRLKAVEEYSMLGAGFRIAMRDLEIRGAGNLLGAEQSGHISAVGYELYCELLQQTVEEMKREGPRVVRRAECTIDLGVNGSLSKTYIPSDMRRIEAYRRIANAKSIEELSKVERDLVTAYGELPRQAQPLIQLTAIRISASAIGVRSIRRHENDIIFVTETPRALEERMAGAMGSLRLVGQPDDKGLTEVYFRPVKTYLDPQSLLPLLRRRLSGEAMATALRP